MGHNNGGPHNRGKGAAVAFLRDNLSYNGAGCLQWPFSKNPNGYGMFGYLGRSHWAHRFMCELMHGPSPDGHEAAHSCGRGKDGCVDPRHLSWKTKSQNNVDAVAHGAHRGNPSGNRGRLTPAQVSAIRRLRGRRTQTEIAAMFGIKPPTVRDIYRGHTYKRVPS